jgi:hypothetical protein
MGNRKSRRLLFVSIGLVGGLVGAAVVVLVLVARQQGLLGLSPEEQAVKAYVLDQAGDPGAVEFMKWGPNDLSGEVTANVGSASVFHSAAADPVHNAAVVRVRWRGPNGQGGKQVNDLLVFVKQGKVTAAIPNTQGDNWLDTARKRTR